MATYTFETTFRPRYRDIDPNGHVNHAVYATYMEQARTEYWRRVIGGRLTDAGVAIVSLEIEYESEVGLDEEVTVAMRISELGRSSIPQVYELRTADRRLATGRAVMVAFDRDERKAKPIPDAWAEAIRAYEAEHGNPLES